jgi:hypothetical protein
MKRFVVGLTSVAILAGSIAGCSAEPSRRGTVTNDLDAKPEVNNETTETSADVPGDTSVTTPSDMNVTTPIVIDYVPADHGRIIPEIWVYIEDEWMPEGDEHYFKFIDLNGNVICDTLFSAVSYIKEKDTYIVRCTENGRSKYGLLSGNGSKFSGLVFDGVAEAFGSTDAGVCFYGTYYTMGGLKVAGLDADYNLLSEQEVTIDTNEFEYDTMAAQLTVQYINGDRAILYNMSEFYYSTYLLDTNTGKLLYSEYTYNDVKLFGNVIIEQQASGEGIKVYDLDGKVILDDDKAYSGRVTDDVYMVANNGELNLYDKDWKVINTLKITANSIVMTSFERIAVFDGSKTDLYDKDLELINTTDLKLYDGTYFRDWYGYGEGDMFFDSIAGTDEIYNLNTGAVLKKEDAFFYSFRGGYIIADNESNGNDPVKKWRIYDNEFNQVLSGEGSAKIFQDTFTGEAYVLVINDTSMTVYSLADGSEVFTYDDYCYNLKAENGVFYGWNKSHFFMIGNSGNVIVSNDVLHRL